MGWFLSVLIVCVALVSFVGGGNKKGQSRTRQGNSYSSVIHGYDGSSSSSDSGGCDGGGGGFGGGGCDGGGF